MRTFLLALLVCSFWSVKGSAQTAASPTLKKVSAPIFLKPADSTPSADLDNPQVPDRGPDGEALTLGEALDVPDSGTLRAFSDPDFFETLKSDKKKEQDILRVYWHRGDPDFCHWRDAEGNHWYGWNDGGHFHWILMKGNRYWWHDTLAGHWLYYAKGDWWLGKPGQMDSIQVLVDGEYYLVQKDGTILKDMGQDGNGNIMSAPGRYQGDFHHGGGGHGARSGGGHSANGSNGASATGDSGSASSGAGTSGR
jgi:hypothetical protein